jgi:hypothetical protein
MQISIITFLQKQQKNACVANSNMIIMCEEMQNLCGWMCGPLNQEIETIRGYKQIYILLCSNLFLKPIFFKVFIFVLLQ